MTGTDTAGVVAGNVGSRDDGAPLTRGSALTLGVVSIWLSLLVLIPLTAVVVKATGNGWSGYWHALSNPSTAAALRLTIGQAVLVTIVNVVMGTLVAWVLVRDDFAGKAVLDLVIDVPFALPTIVAGLVLLSLYGPDSPVGLHFANTRVGIFIALLFVTVPFVVRAVQPVLLELDRDVEEAAASLGASRTTIFRRIVLPNLAPAIAAGTALCFARAVSEYGSLVLISGNLPFRTEVAAVRILSLNENDNPAGAAAVASVLLVVAVVALLSIDGLRRWAVRRA
ncbi:MAG: sulfate ABC transporter permease subunit CysT [Microthrixaceae bacterium]|nr:sulfate ABC transporter permease subunit CysT [Microthrixaceae bacterium]MCO5313958.1 sulfate ABC transporter permease subunit CysT [Microthrixaceae bacterium]